MRLLFIACCTFLLACKTSADKKDLAKTPVSDTVAYRYDTLLKRHNADTNTQVQIIYPVFAVNNALTDSLRTWMYAMGYSQGKAPAAWADGFLAEYNAYKKEGGMVTDASWDYQYQAQVLHNAADLQVLSVSSGGYTGGAHPNYYTDYINVYKGQRIFHEALVEDSLRNAFALMNQDYIKQTIAGITHGSASTWRENGCIIIEDSIMPVSRSFRIEPGNGIYMLYNPYAISCYAFGPIEYTIPISKLKPFLSSAGKKVFGL